MSKGLVVGGTGVTIADGLPSTYIPWVTDSSRDLGSGKTLENGLWLLWFGSRSRIFGAGVGRRGQEKTEQGNFKRGEPSERPLISELIDVAVEV